jgi:type VI secretion system secreted protein VgrG
MAISTKISIHIDGEPLSRFSKLVIQQKVHTHHTFSLLQPLPREFVNQAVDKAQNYIGKTIKIEIQPNGLKTEAPLIFNGIIAEAQMIRTSGASGGIIINGYSPTIALEGIPKTKSFTDQSLSDIIKSIMSNYGQFSLRPLIDIKNDTTLPYTVQYKESDFSFICRLAQKKGKWFYFNGEELVFGELKSKDFILEYGRSLHSFNIEMRAKPLGLEYLGYDSSSAETQRANATEINYQPEGYSKIMYETSKKLFPDTATMLYTHPIEEGSARTHLIDRVTTQLHSRSADLVTAKGDSDETGLRIGDIVSIQEPAFSMTGNILDGLQEQNFGSYIITDIVHVCDETGSYHNTFQAVPDTVLAPPYGNVHNHPTTDTQTAIVTDNNDPKGLGRIQVKFAWQEGNTPWIRMINPHSGSGKGIYFIPEIGEEVLVGFEAGNAEKPFVLGGMYNGNATSNYATPSNDKKVIQTRSGNKMIMDDAAGSFCITDQGTVNMLFDGAGNATTNSDTTNAINVGKNRESVLKMDSEGNITLDGKTSLTITIGNSKLEMKEDGTITFNGKNITTNGENIKTIGTTSVDISSPKNHIGGGDTKIDGGDVFIN